LAEGEVSEPDCVKWLRCRSVGESFTSEDSEAVQWLLAEIAPPEQCQWREDEDGQWHTACGHTFEFIDDGPEENGFNFCYSCGHPVAALRTAGEGK
jgi:hypothetical protein